MEVKASRPDTASPVRMSQSDQLMLTISGERMRESDCSREKTIAMNSPEIAAQLTKTGVETPWNVKISVWYGSRLKMA